MSIPTEVLLRRTYLYQGEVHVLTVERTDWGRYNPHMAGVRAYTVWDDYTRAWRNGYLNDARGVAEQLLQQRKIRPHYLYTPEEDQKHRGELQPPSTRK